MNNRITQGWHTSYLATLTAWCVGVMAGHTLAGEAGRWLMAAPVELGRRLREMSLSGSGGDLFAWAIVAAICALPFLGLLWKGRQKADLLLPIASGVLGIWLFYLVNPTLLDTVLPAVEGWGLCGIAAAGSLLAAWAALRLLKKLDRGSGRLPELMTWGATLYALILGVGTVLRVQEQAAAVAAANTAQPNIAAFTANTMETIAVWQSLPSLMTAVLVMWGGELLKKLEEDPFGEETVVMAEQIAKRCDLVVYLTLFVTVSSNLTQMARFTRLASIDVKIYFPVLTLALAAVLRTLCRYFRRAKAVSDDNDTII